MKKKKGKQKYSHRTKDQNKEGGGENDLARDSPYQGCFFKIRTPFFSPLFPKF